MIHSSLLRRSFFASFLLSAWGLFAACDSGDGGSSGSGSATLTAIVISPDSLQLPLGFTEDLTATGHYSDGTTLDITTQAQWMSLDTAIAVVGSSALDSGVVAGAGLGEVDITATLPPITATLRISVITPVLSQISVSPSNIRIATGTTRPFSCTAFYQGGYNRDATADASWSSTDDGVASVGNGAADKGEVTGNSEGECEIIARLAGLSDRSGLGVVRVDRLDTDVDLMAATSAPNVAIDDAATVMAAWSYEGEDPGRVFFSTRDGAAWSAKDELGGVSESARHATLAATGGGVRFLVWSGTTAIWGARHDEVGGWSSPVALASGSASDDFAPDIALAAHSAGDAVAVWRSTRDSMLRSKIYTDGSGWGPTDPLVDVGESVEPIALVSNAAGDVIVAWQNRTDGVYELYASRYTLLGGWEMEVLLWSSTLFHQPSLAIDSAGNAKMAFIDISIFPESQLLVTSFDPAVGWDTPVLVTDEDVPREPAIGIDEAGAAVVAWKHAGAGGTAISASRYVVADEEWQERELLKSSPGGSPEPLAPWLDGAGGAVGYWITDSFEDGTKLELIRFDPDDGWGELDSFDFIGASGSVRNIDFSLHPSGSAVVSWVELADTTEQVFVHEFESALE